MPESGILSELKNAICTPCYFVVIADLTLAKLPFIEFIIASYNYVKYRGVEAKAVVDDPTPAEPVYDPTHPLADERGYIYESNVDVATEQLDATEAENMYSANMAVFEVVKSMASKALTLGKG